jgi:6-phosphofructo-2-kinase/fructose-2,6-biphosphatase 2
MEMARPRKTNGIGIGVEDTQICVVMVGLPARGKSLIAQKGELLLNEWLPLCPQTLY